MESLKATLNGKCFNGIESKKLSVLVIDWEVSQNALIILSVEAKSVCPF